MSAFAVKAEYQWILTQWKREVLTTNTIDLFPRCHAKLHFTAYSNFIETKPNIFNDEFIIPK